MRIWNVDWKGGLGIWGVGFIYGLEELRRWGVGEVERWRGGGGGRG